MAKVVKSAKLKMGTVEFEVKQVTLADTKVESGYQRGQVSSTVKRIVNQFNPRAVGLPVLVQRGKKYHIIDGQNRIAALKDLGIKEWPCVVHGPRTMKAEETRSFIDCNKGKEVSKVVMWYAALYAREKWALAVEKCVRNLGLCFVPKDRPMRLANNEIGCIGLVMQLHAEGGLELIRDTLEVIIQAFNQSPPMPLTLMIDATDHVIVAGISGYIARAKKHGRYPGNSTLARVLSNATPSDWLTIARDASNGGNYSQRKALTDKIYNEIHYSNRMKIA